MSRNGSGVYSLPAGSIVTDGTTIDASDHNTPLQDLETDMNTARPVVAGGTGATTASAARTNLGLGSIATQASTSVDIDGGAIDGTNIGASTPGTGAFSTLTGTTIDGVIGSVTPAAATVTDLTASGTLTLGGAVTMWDQASVADDAVMTVTMPRTAGHLMISLGAYPIHAGIVWVYVAGTVQAFKSSWDSATLGSDLDLDTSDSGLSGTTGTDGNVTVAPRSDNTVQIENRSGDTRTITVFAP